MYTTQGIVLKKIPIGEADALFTIYTKDYGKIRAMAQGVKKEEAKLKGHLEPLNLVQLGFVLGRSGERLTQASSLNHWPDTKSNWNKITVIYRVVDWVDRSCLVGEKDEALWNLLIDSFRGLEAAENFMALNYSHFVEDFEKKLSNVLGYGEKGLKSVEYMYVQS